MKKLLLIIIAIILVISVTGCSSSQENVFYNELNQMTFDDEVLFVDGNYFFELFQYISIEEPNSSYYRWSHVFRQNTDLYKLLNYSEYKSDISIDHSQLLEDIENTNEYEVESKITLIYKNGLRNIVKEMDVIWYNFTQKYDDQYKLNESLYYVDVDSIGYYSFEYYENDVLHCLYYNYEDITQFSVFDETIIVEEHYLGYDFSFVKDGEVYDKKHIISFDKVYPDSNDKKLNIYIGEEVYSSFDSISPSKYLRSIITPGYDPIITFAVQESIHYESVYSDIVTLDVSKTYVVYPDVTVTYELVKDEVIEFEIETINSIRTYRILIE